MPWEVTLVNYGGAPPANYYAADRPDPQPLGGHDEVIEWIKVAAPELEWGQSETLPPEMLAAFSPEIREMMARPQLRALYEDAEFSLELYGFEQEPIASLHADLRGDGNPLLLLARICAGRRWSVVNGADGSFVDLEAARPEQWDAFREWRDRAVGGIESQIDPAPDAGDA
jgi:hypothetical protein